MDPYQNLAIRQDDAHWHWSLRVSYLSGFYLARGSAMEPVAPGLDIIDADLEANDVDAREHAIALGRRRYELSAPPPEAP